MEQLESVGAVEDGVILAALLAVVAGDTDVGPAGAESVLDVVELVIENFLKADNGDGARGCIVAYALDCVDDMGLTAAVLGDSAEEVPPRLFAGFAGAGVVSDVERGNTDGETLSQSYSGQENGCEKGLDLHLEARNE